MELFYYVYIQIQVTGSNVVISEDYKGSGSTTFRFL